MRASLILGICVVATLSCAQGCHGLFLKPGLVGETRVESAHFALRTDVTGEGRATLLAEAESMRGELDALIPSGPGLAEGGKREVVAFARAEDFKRYLRAHLFSQERAIGFFCDMGGECALVWRDPPGPEDVRVLRHELVHQHVAARLKGRLPAWLEEGLAERIALGVDADGPFGGTLIAAGPGRAPGRDDGAAAAARGPGRAEASTRLLVPPSGLAASAAGGPSWSVYRARRFRADAIFAALEVHGGRASWPEARSEGTTAVPPPLWAAGEGEGGYVLHLLFVRFLESVDEGRAGAIGRVLARAAAGEDAALDLSHRFRTLGALEDAFHAFVLGQGLAALIAETEDEARRDPSAALRRLEELSSAPGAASVTPRDPSPSAPGP